MSRGRTATSADVARLAGVSQPTVSVVLNGARGNNRVSADTRQRVLAAAADLGYSPNALAQALRRRRTGTIGFVPAPLSTDAEESPLPIMHLFGLHVARAAAHRGFHILEASAETTVTRQSGELVEFLLGRRVDAVIYDRPGSVDQVRPFVDRGVPVVQLLRVQPVAATATVTVDPAPGIDAAIAHLAAQNHRRIAILTNPESHPANSRRLDAFRDALAREGIALPDDYVQRRSTEGKYALTEGIALTEALLALPTPPTAIFAAQENIALGVLRALYRARRHVPDDLSLISYDDTFAVHVTPALTSVAQPAAEIAEQAVTLIARQLEDPDHDAPAHIVLPTRLVIRESTGPAPESPSRICS